jgi:branched-chain amino acid transport system ATP-binding protein
MAAVPEQKANPILSVVNIEVIYDHVILVLRGVSLEVLEGQIVALLGANGAGKTTTLKAISNLLRAERGDVTKGRILYRGERIDQLNPSALVKRGICQVMEGRHCFQHLTVEENLLTGAYTRGYIGSGVKEELEKVYTYFPRLKERRSSQSGYTSGGEQQMTAIGRALMARPQLMLLDEPSMGLAPILVEQIFTTIAELKRSGLTVLLVEQNAHAALAIADRAYVLETGRIVLTGPAHMLREDERVRGAYLGL